MGAPWHGLAEVAAVLVRQADAAYGVPWEGAPVSPVALPFD